MKQWIKKYRVGIILTGMIVLQLCYITYVFAFQREGFHSDEAWSYQFANANYERMICEDEDGNAINEKRWQDSQLFRNFMEVQDGMQFHYDAVLYNMSTDLNPPLHSLLLHTVCSFAPDTFSWWYAYVINIVAFVCVMVALYYFARELTASRRMALAICLFYGCTTGALYTFMYLRGYAMLTVFSILLAFLHCRMYKQGFRVNYRYLAALFAVMVLGCLTHYGFFMFGFCFAAVFCLYTLCTKRWRFMVFYGLVMALSVVVVMLLWPPAAEMFAGRDTIYRAQMPLRWEIEVCLQLLIREATGVPFQVPSAVFWAWVEAILIYAAIFAAGIGFLLRKNSRFRALAGRVVHGIRPFFRELPGRLRRTNKFYVLCVPVCVGTLIIIADICDIYSMGIFSDRYLFFLMPVVSVLFLSAVSSLIRKCVRGRKRLAAVLFAGVLVISLLSNHVLDTEHYLLRRQCDGAPIEELTRDANVILVPWANWRLAYYAPLLLDSKNFFVVRTKESMDVMEELGALTDIDGPVYLIAESKKFRPEDYVKDESMPDGERTVAEMLTVEWKLSELVQEYAGLGWATRKEFIQEEQSFVGKLSIWRLR